MTPEQRQESVRVSQVVMVETDDRTKPYTLEEFSYDYFRYTDQKNMIDILASKTNIYCSDDPLASFLSPAISV